MQWSEPEGNPEVTRESKQWVHKQAAYADVVREWRSRQQQLAAAMEEDKEEEWIPNEQ